MSRPFHAQWEKDGHRRPRDVWLSGGEQGLLGFDLEEQYGGGGVRDFRFNAVIGRGDRSGSAPAASASACTTTSSAPYLRDLATEEQKQRWLPGFCAVS